MSIVKSAVIVLIGIFTYIYWVTHKLIPEVPTVSKKCAEDICVKHKTKW